MALREEANSELDQQIEIGNNVFTTSVDGRAAQSRTAISRAMKNVRINFPLVAVDLALAVMKQAMRQAIVKTTRVRTGKLSSNIRMFYGGDKKHTIEVTNTAEIKEFLPGDYVVLYPVTDYATFANMRVSERTGQGFMRRAAASVRRTIKQKKTSGGLAIYVKHSRRMAQYVGGDAVKARYGVPVLYVKWKAQEIRNLGV